MDIFGLIAKAFSKPKFTKPCERCGLHYPEDESDCPHCHEISSEFELNLFKEKIEQEKQAGGKLGQLFFMFSLMIGVLLLLSILDG
ncbi:MAG: hypothetical protein V7785_09075 [Bermanella sp.]